MAEQGNVFQREFVTNLLVSDQKRYLEKISGVGNRYLTPIDEQQMDVLLLVQYTDIANSLSCAREKVLHFSAVGFDNKNCEWAVASFFLREVESANKVQQIVVS